MKEQNINYVLGQPCGEFCPLFGIMGGGVFCSLALHHDGDHETTIKIAKPPMKFSIRWAQNGLGTTNGE